MEENLKSLFEYNRVVEESYNVDQQNCFNCLFQFNGNRWRINLSTTLIFILFYFLHKTIKSLFQNFNLVF
ncbi:hypothetical protein [Leptospira interrogans]|uniref:hypothetical protein n=1 Tax=Leptospira interrogans TaxID=173 RepID=UPI0009E5046B|nr:hypothetical protein [Leptospira interrogans]QOI40358.1 hypothetical protein Lepto1548_16795 [Leptospira interrogans serovar Bataviae]